MKPEEIQKNYHSYLTDIKDLFDPVIEKMRSQKNEEWRGQAWLAPINQIIGLAKHFKLLTFAKGFLFPLMAPAIVVLTGWYNSLPLSYIIGISIVILFATYYILVQRHIAKMATLGHPEFHVEALKATRPEEYKLWSHFIQKDDFSFNGLASSVNSLLGPRTDNSIHTLEAMIIDEKRQNKEHQIFIASLTSEVDKSDASINYLVSIITEINANLYRLTNDVLDFSDLRFVTPFTIYALNNNMLRKIKDVGTSGGSPKQIDLSIPRDPEYAVVTAVKSATNAAFADTPYPGRLVVAFSMRMLKGEKWVWCFHFDDSDERALSLVLSNDTIESRQIRRLVHVFCLILQKHMIATKEATQDAEEQAN
ncbi:hypothetical protein OB236_14500 [Paenibacillus sp. WQ 127069]|uniref:DUF3137 domain-containing protein n=1 Tax=Paenibacillus baimaensis TaxID=2982185 RepID=A0ABT2UFA8_9BACL|nr:hypothetical protein [Paenibacillus sp. WQ 127069]MCU6793321.1 hypothetical protein [Paenibacillus sp. WQ 127069]